MLGVSDAPRPVASAACNLVRWWSGTPVPFVIAAAAVTGAVIV